MHCSATENITPLKSPSPQGLSSRQVHRPVRLKICIRTRKVIACRLARAGIMLTLKHTVYERKGEAARPWPCSSAV